jgi:hypothetical protein
MLILNGRVVFRRLTQTFITQGVAPCQAMLPCVAPTPAPRYEPP